MVAKVPITMMGYRCERCEHEWIPRGSAHTAGVPKGKSSYAYPLEDVDDDIEIIEAVDNFCLKLNVSIETWQPNLPGGP